MPSLWEILGVLLEFLPQVFLLYLVLTFTEKSGLLSWMARLLHIPVNNLMAVGLGFGCTTLGICAVRDNPARKRLTFFLSFIPCTAQLPLITFILLSILHWPFWSVIILYLLCIAVGLGAMLCVRPSGQSVIYEPVKLHFPNLWQCLWETIKQTLSFAKKIFMAFAVSAFVVVILARFDFHWHFTTDPRTSMLFNICGILSPIFAPIGLGNPALICALLFGIIAKESAISVLLFFPDVVASMTLPVALSLLAFYTFYPKCISAQTAACSSCDHKTGVKLFFTNLLVAYVVALVVYNICGFFI